MKTVRIKYGGDQNHRRKIHRIKKGSSEPSETPGHSRVTSLDILDTSAKSNACIPAPKSLPSKAQKMLMYEDWPGGLGAVGFDLSIKWRACSKAVTVFIVIKRDGRIVIIINQSIPSISTAISRKIVRKVHATISKGILGGFEFIVIQRSLKE